jgi:hypothetical protein
MDLAAVLAYLPAPEHNPIQGDMPATHDQHVHRLTVSHALNPAIGTAY